MIDTEDLEMPRPVNTTTPNAARMYDYYLGGEENFPADQVAAEHVLRVAPWIRATARENRAFLGRAVDYLAREAGIRQFVDIGTGLPTKGNVHEVAHAVAPDARVAYVDNDPIVLGKSRYLLARVPNAGTVRADVRRPVGIIGHPDLTALIDWGQPVALLLVAVLHFVTDGYDPAAIVAQFRDVMAPGSHLVISHAHHEGDDDAVRQAVDIYRGADAPLVMRGREQIAGFFDGFDLLDPVLVYLPGWRPVPRPYPPGEVWGIGGVGRLRAPA